MKKLILMAVMALATVTSFAQQAVGTFTIQPKVGLNLANLTDANGDIRAGVAAGVEFEYQVSDIFSLSAGALYSMQGSKYSEDKIDYTASSTISTFLSLPTFTLLRVLPLSSVSSLAST